MFYMFLHIFTHFCAFLHGFACFRVISMFWCSRGDHGALLGSLGALLGALGALLGRFGVALGALGLLLGALECSGVALGRSWGALGWLDWVQTNAPTTALTMRLAKKIDVQQDVLPRRCLPRSLCIDASCLKSSLVI